MVALLSLKKKKNNHVGGGGEKEQGGRRPGRQIIQQQKTVLLPGCYINSPPTVLRYSLGKNWCLVTLGLISHLSFQLLRGALTTNDSVEGGLDCHFDLLDISIPS